MPQKLSGSAVLESVVHSVCYSLALCIFLRILRFYGVLQVLNNGILQVLSTLDLQMIYQDLLVLLPYVLGIAVMHWKSRKQVDILQRQRFQAGASARVKLYYLAL